MSWRLGYSIRSVSVWITNRFAALENLSEVKDIHKAWENIKENIKASDKESLGLHKMKQHKPWFDEEYLGFSDQGKQDKMQWLQDKSQSYVGNLNNVRCEASRHFINKKEYLKAKIEKPETNSKINKRLGTCIGYQ
jgi:predicted metallo-beta-lactamase superfamily hydrolase